MAARLAATLDYIASHFSDPELSLTKVAQSLRISPRYLQRLLETSGTSFTAHVTELRLKQAFMLLTSQCGDKVRISTSHCRLAFPIFRTSTGCSVPASAIRQVTCVPGPQSSIREVISPPATRFELRWHEM